jgi:hypothetical protein
MRWLIAALLLGCASAPRPKEAPGDPVVLNHVFAVLDPETVAAIEADPFVNEQLGKLAKQTTQMEGLTFTGLYLYGRETYLELFSPDPQSPLGMLGIGLGVDRAGGLARLAKRVRAAGHPFFTTLARRQDEAGKLIPWFQSGGTKAEGPEEPLNLWVMEYLGGRPRLAALAKTHLPERLIRDLRAVELMGTAKERDYLATTLAAWGWSVRREGDTMIASNHEGTELRFTADPTRRGLLAVRFALMRAVSREERVLGKSTLVLGPSAEALWRFAPTEPPASGERTSP